MMNRRKQSAPKLRRKRGGGSECSGPILNLLIGFGTIVFLVGTAFLYEFSKSGTATTTTTTTTNTIRRVQQQRQQEEIIPNNDNDVLLSKDGLPILPVFSPVPNAQHKMDETILEGKPSIAGIIAILQNFLRQLHTTNVAMMQGGHNDPTEVLENYFNVAKEHLRPFEKKYQDQSIFPIDTANETIFLSLAAYREHLLADTLQYAFRKAKHPEKLFVGAVVQNCFGRVNDDGTIDASGTPCKTGLEVVGKNAQGRDQTKLSDAPADKNGIDIFCRNAEFRQYCVNGQIRVLYVHSSESLGPAVARYYASKLWGGETYFVQTDSHLLFADEWDAKYIAEIKATRNYPKSVLSAYPPGFSGHMENSVVTESHGSRLCYCETLENDPNPIVRINSGSGYHGAEPRPTQIPFIAAGFFFTRAEFLTDVPFDPYLPWCFMGEEIALSIRAWTSGWNIYAPRKNLIEHQYRPGRLGLPKFWESVNQFWHRPQMNNFVQGKMIMRLKHMVGYLDATLEVMKDLNLPVESILFDMDQYSIGKERTWEDYLQFAHMKMNPKTKRIDCSANHWCNAGEKE